MCGHARASLAARAAVLAALLAALAAAGCGIGGPAASSRPASPTPSPTPAPSPSPSSTPTAAPRTPSAAEIVAVARQTYPLGSTGAYGQCNAGPGLSACPFTQRLTARLTALAPSARANLVCRCQNVSLTFAATGVPAAGGGVAHVVLFGGSSRIDLTVVLASGRLLVDDISCTGQPGTSTYAAGTPGPCSG